MSLSSSPLSRQNRRAVLQSGLLALAAWSLSGQASGQDPAANGSVNLDKCVSQLADSIKTYLQGVNQSDVVMGAITAGDPSQLATGGTLIRTKLMERLKAGGINCTRVAQHGITGSFVGEAQNNRPGFAVAITASVTEKGKKATTFSDMVYDVEDMAKLLGATTELPVPTDAPQQSPNGKPIAPPANSPDSVQRVDALQTSIAQPNVSVEPRNDGSPASVVFASKESTYGVEVLVRSSTGTLEPRPPVVEGNQAFIDLAPGEKYAIRLTNRSGYDAGATISIDGLSSFHFSENIGYKQLDKWVIAHHSSGIIEGWHLRDTVGAKGERAANFAAFEVTKFGEEPASKLDKAEAIGAITVTFHAAWDANQAPPPDELEREKVRGTKPGEEFVAPIRELRRVFGKARAVVTIRYQQPPNLPL